MNNWDNKNNIPKNLIIAGKLNFNSNFLIK